ncbi:phosphatase PAP2 family protein [Glaciecola petra]|uniref:undecaprenyl-diphosphate phosphatase n=1 Tax=Glaciecola petra TaxID=3075602 RepID=A0ABU2ZUF6_9ALTE|nr:phosphatase PAP2 family protein [Aestuariibacter sp. P117]MDT0595673.1 phosphatase PAP2 family protein [Aestuariibacter sp. P117]
MNKLTSALVDIDNRLFKWAVELPVNQQNAFLPKFFFLVSKSADGYLYLIIAMVAYYFEKEYGVLFFYTALLAYSIEIPIYLALKQIFKRPRPCDVKHKLDTFVDPADKFSLPSGHTAAAFLMATIFTYFYPSTFFLVYGWAALVGISRVVLRVHYPSDVSIGAILGVSIAICSIEILG